MAEESVVRVSLDRVEEGIAVLLTEEGSTWHLKLERLPTGSREGDILDVIFRRNPEETEALAGRVAELQQMLLRRTGERGGDGVDDE